MLWVRDWWHGTASIEQASKQSGWAVQLLTLWLQVNINNLKDRAYWACGWLQHIQLEALDNPTETICKACGGAGIAKGFVKL